MCTHTKKTEPPKFLKQYFTRSALFYKLFQFWSVLKFTGSILSPLLLHLVDLKTCRKEPSEGFADLPVS